MDTGPQQLARVFLFFGAVMIISGVILILVGKYKLPGDIQWEWKNIKVYLPIATCVIISLILTLILWLISWLKK